MPRLPGIPLQPSASLPSVQTNRQSVGAQAEARAAANIGQAIEKVSGVLTDVYVESQIDNRTAKATSKLNDYVERLKRGEIRVGERPADPLEFQQLFEAERDRVMEEVREGMVIPGIGPDRKIQARMRQVTDRQLLEVKTFALDRFKEGTSVNALESMLEDSRNYVSATDMEKSAIEERVNATAAKLVNAGVWRPEEAYRHLKNWRVETETGSFLKLLNESPEAAIIAIKNGEFKRLGPEAEQKWLARAKSAKQEQERAAEAERRRRETEERTLKNIARDENFKRLLEKRDKGDLDRQEIYDNREDLKPDQFKTLLTAAREGVKTSDRDTYTKLYIAAHEGKDVSLEATNELGKKLTLDDYNRIMGVVSSESEAFKGRNIFKAGKEHLLTAFGSDELKGPMEAQRKADALAVYQEITTNNPELFKTLTDVTKFANELVDSARIASNRELGTLATMRLKQADARFYETDDEDEKVNLFYTAMVRTEGAYRQDQMSKLEYLAEKVKLRDTMVRVFNPAQRKALRDALQKRLSGRGLIPTPLMNPTPSPSPSPQMQPTPSPAVPGGAK